MFAALLFKTCKVFHYTFHYNKMFSSESTTEHVIESGNSERNVAITRRVHNRLPWERRRRRSDNRQRVSASHVLPKATRLVSRSLPLQLGTRGTHASSVTTNRLGYSAPRAGVRSSLPPPAHAARPSHRPDTFMTLAFERL